ncbi:MAG: ATP-binding cassette domain-containing protein [Smithellaceae bacterium]|nr:ATP-binding cassette domain-containing protein [Smithellaceae bacterium]
MTREAVVEIHSLVAGYGRHQVLHKLDLTVCRGEALGIAGDNGTGKTTLFKVILGLIAPMEGDVSVQGQMLDTPRVRRLIRCQIGYVPQLHTPGKMPVSVHDAVLMGRWSKGFGFFKRPVIQDRQKVSEILQEIGLSHKEWRPVHLLSGGEQQKVSIGRALVREASILLLDEPSTYLDHASQAEIIELIRTVHLKHHLTLIMISHDPEHLEAISDRILLLKNGRLEER